MSSPAQIAANRANAQLSTGPRTETGKAAAAQNRATHGLASNGFFFLPDEDPEEFHQLLAAYSEEHQPGGPTESFLVRELAQAEWKLRRAGRIEAALLESPEGNHPLAAFFQAGATPEQAFLKLTRYETTIRRNFFRALGELRAIRRDYNRALRDEARQLQAQADAELKRVLAATPPLRSASEPQKNDSKPNPPAPDDSKPISKPMPTHLERELAAHKRRDSDFDPIMDASQMSKQLRRWFERNAT